MAINTCQIRIERNEVHIQLCTTGTVTYVQVACLYDTGSVRNGNQTVDPPEGPGHVAVCVTINHVHWERVASVDIMVRHNDSQGEYEDFWQVRAEPGQYLPVGLMIPCQQVSSSRI